MPDDPSKTEPPKKGEVTAAVNRAEQAELRAKLAEELAAEVIVKAKKDEGVSAAKWKMISDLVTGPNLKWVMAAIVVIALVTASIFSGKVFTVSQGGVVFGASDKVVEGTPLSDEDAALKEKAPLVEVTPPTAPPTVITRVVERVVEVPVPAPTLPVAAPPTVVRTVSRPAPSPVVIEPEPTPEPEPAPEPEPVPEPTPEEDHIGPAGPEQ